MFRLRGLAGVGGGLVGSFVRGGVGRLWVRVFLWMCCRCLGCGSILVWGRVCFL